MSLIGKVDTVVRTDAGRVRTNNEDAVAQDIERGLLLLADGMGGHNAGEVASSIAISTIQEVVRAGWDWIKHGSTDDRSGHTAEALLLRGAVEAAHAAIKQAARDKPLYEGMGTTIVACLLHGDTVAIAHVGDSRLYRMREGRLEQLTRDHSLVEELVDKGFYDREEAKKHVRRNILTRAVGTGDLITVDLLEEPLAIGDLLLLCSDGLTEMVSDEEIGLTLRNFADRLDEAAKKLIDMANEKGGKDNVSVVLARVDGTLGTDRRWFHKLADWL